MTETFNEIMIMMKQLLFTAIAVYTPSDTLLSALRTERRKVETFGQLRRSRPRESADAVDAASAILNRGVPQARILIEVA